eukprot:TRINITY_DN3642_c0_g1_i7.p1 TRINITY_DN3642_c0_g1~~TRINITY_DN3642_c0_g1_i7.p1  ORF type:complete len:116 (-),score=8.02 TRINITY_DN3642_c0_g1_i7:26-373(-)
MRLHGNGLLWIIGSQGEGDCNEICSHIPCPRGFCVPHQCSENAGREAASDLDNVNFEPYTKCNGTNSWNYGQGFSKCTDPTCCHDGSCQGHCSLPTTWPGCKIADGFAYGYHSRI